LQFLKADYTEVWISRSMIPLVQFADAVSSIASTGIDLVGLGDRAMPPGFARRVQCFDEIVSWYGSKRAEFREALAGIHPRCVFLPALPDAKCRQHATDFFLQQVGAPLGLIPQVSVPDSEPRRTLVVHPFSGSAQKNWPLDRYRQLASRFPLEFTAGPDEVLAGAARFENLLDLARWMKGGAAYAGNDSGISHLAAALGIPSLVLFGSTDPAIWAPRGPNVRVLEHRPLCHLPVERVSEELLSLCPNLN
jgi:hypothetical protein